MKKTTKVVMLFGFILVLITGCGNSSAGHTKSTNNVDNVLNQQVNSAENSEIAENVVEQEVDTLIVDETIELQEEKENTISDGDIADIDYDLTKMGSDMVYATVYQLMVSPEEYVGKTFKMNGLYYATYYEPTNQIYHYCIIQDATACCAQGLEFVWDDGSHKYPDEYPEDDSEIVVMGVFETYMEEDILYCRLSDATMEVE